MPNPLPIVTIDLLEDMGGDNDIIHGPNFFRTAIVTGLIAAAGGTGNTDSGTLYTLVNNAIIAFTGGFGTPMPNLATPNYFKNIGQHKYNSADEARAKLTYSGFPALQIEFNSSLAQVEDYLDKDGNPLTVVYAYPNNYSTITGGNPAYNGLSVTQGVAESRPTSDLTFTIRTTTTGGVNSVTPLCGLVGFVNQSSYPIGTIAGAARTWLCTACQSRSEDSGFTFNLAMSFQYRATTWDNKIFFINPDTGRPPPDLIAGTGAKRPMLALETNFPLFI